MSSIGLIRPLAHLAAPVLVAQVAVMANGVIDTVMAGRLSALDLAAVGIGAAVYVTVFVTLLGVLLALTPIVAHLHGAGRHAEIGEQVRQSAWLAVALSAPALAVLAHPEPLLALSRLTPEVEATVRAYLAAMAWSVPAALLFRVFYGFMAGIGRPRAVMVINLVGLGLKIPLNLVFMHGEAFGHAVFPAMGGAGCAAATAVISWIMVALAWGWCGRRVDCEGYGVFARWTLPRLGVQRDLLRLGLPIGATYFVDVTAFTFMALFIARLGAVASGAHQIAANLAALTFMLPLALGNAAAVLCGQALGGGDPQRARHIGLAGLALGLALATVVSAILAVAAPAIAAWYTPDARVQAAAAPLIAWVAAYHWVDALQAVAVNLLRGYKKTVVPMLIYALALWGVGLGGGFLVGLTDWLGPARGAAGFWSAATLSLACAGALVTGYFLGVSRACVSARRAIE